MTTPPVFGNSQPRNVSASLEIAEQIMLRETSPQIWLEYIKKTGRGRWPEVEEKLLEWFPWRCSREAKRYAEEVIKGRWRKLEEKILTGESTRNSRHEVLCYTRDVVKKRWPDLESLLLSRCRSGCCLVYCVEYASTVIQGRWRRLEREFLNNADAVPAEVLYRYACRVVEGRLPEKLNNLMIMKGTMDSGKKVIRQYLRAKKYHKVRKPR